MESPTTSQDRDPLQDPKVKKKALFTVSFTLFLDLMGFGIILPVLPFFAQHHGATATAVTLLSTVFSAAQFVMAPVLGRLSDRLGRRPVMLISIFGSVAASLTLGIAWSLWVVFAARLISGISKANVSTAYACVADLVEPEERAKQLGKMGAAIGLGFICGPAVGGLLSIEGLPMLPFFISAGLSAINFVMAWLWLPETLSTRDQSATASKRFRVVEIPSILRELRGTKIGWLLVISFLFYIAFSSMESTMALFGEALLGWKAGHTGAFIAYIGLVMVITQGLLIGRIVKLIGEAKTLMFGLGCTGLGLISLSILSFDVGIPLGELGAMSWQSLVMIGLGGLFMAGGNGLSNASIGALISRFSKPNSQGWNMGLKESASALARMIGPVFAGPLFEFVHMGAPLLLGGLFAWVNLVLAWKLSKK